jgi:hypothetical protein
VAGSQPRLRERHGAFTLLSTLNYFTSLLVYDLDLLIDYVAGKPVDRHVQAAILLAFDDKLGEMVLRDG